MRLKFYIETCFTNNSHHVTNPPQLSNPWTFYNPKLYFTFTTREKKMYDISCLFSNSSGETIHPLIGGLTTNISDSSVEVTNHSKVWPLASTTPFRITLIPVHTEGVWNLRQSRDNSLKHDLFQSRRRHLLYTIQLYCVFPWIKYYLQTYLINGLTCQ